MKKAGILLLTISMFFISGCITIYEKYTIHKDGSGNMEYIIDMSEMYQMLAAFSDSTTEDQMDPNIMEESLRQAIPELSAIPGISNVDITGDLSNYIAGIKFDFKDSKALNHAMSVLLETEEIKAGNTDDKYVILKKKSFTRNSRTSQEIKKEDFLNSEELDEETAKMLMESMKYNISVTFDKPVKKVSSNTQVSQDENTVTLETNFAEIFSKEDFLKTTIRTK